MSLSIKFSLFIVLLVFSILSTVTVVLVTIRTQQMQQELIEKDKITSELLSRELSDGFSDYYFYQYDTYREFVRKKFTDYEDIVHFALYNTSGEKLFDTNHLEDPPGTTPAEAEKITDPSLLSVISEKKQIQDITNFGNERTIRIFQPYIDKFGVYRNMFELHFSTKEVEETMKQTIQYSIGLLSIFTVVSVASTFVLVNQIIKPVKKLTEVANSFSHGNLNTKIDTSSKDEIGTLAKAFKQMATDLQTSHGELAKQNQNLEQEVANRTKELKEQLAEMERLQKLTVDRELKMIEMKKELELLKRTSS